MKGIVRNPLSQSGCSVQQRKARVFQRVPHPSIPSRLLLHPEAGMATKLLGEIEAEAGDSKSKMDKPAGERMCVCLDVCVCACVYVPQHRFYYHIK